MLHTHAQTGQRVGYVADDEISLGTIRDVIENASRIRISWDDGSEDTEDDGWWDWPQTDLEYIRPAQGAQ